MIGLSIFTIVLVVAIVWFVAYFAPRDAEASVQARMDYWALHYGNALERTRRAVRAREWPLYNKYLEHCRYEHEEV